MIFSELIALMRAKVSSSLSPTAITNSSQRGNAEQMLSIKGYPSKVPFRIKVKRLIFISNTFFNHGEPVVFNWCHLLRLLQFAGDAKLDAMQLRIHPILCQQFTMGARFDKLALL